MTEVCMRGGKREGGCGGELAVGKKWRRERGWGGGGGHLVGQRGGGAGEESQARGGVAEMRLVLRWEGRIVLC